MKGYVAHETFITDIAMYLQIFRVGLIVGIVVQLLVLLLSVGFIFHTLFEVHYYNTEEKIIAADFILYCLPIEKISLNSNPSIFLSPRLRRLFYYRQYVGINEYRGTLDRSTNNAFWKSKQNIIRSFWFSFAAYLFSIFYITLFLSSGALKNKNKYIRGAQLDTLKELNKKLEEASSEDTVINLKIGDTPIPFEMETMQTLILGATRTGKGVLINQLIKQINQRKPDPSKLIENELKAGKINNRIIMYDIKGEYIGKHYDPETSMIFSPFDQRSVQWNLFNEIQTPPDFDIIAKSLFAAPVEKDDFWYNAAKAVFRTGLIYLAKKNEKTNKHIRDFFALPLEVIVEILRTNLPIEEQGALKFIDKVDSDQSASITSILVERIDFFRFLGDMDGDFSFREYIRNESCTDNLFLLNIKKYDLIFKPLMTLAINSMIRECLSLEDDLDRRIFWVVDEIGSLYKLDSLIDFQTMAASKGGALICANQDLGRIEENYGRSILRTFVNNFNTYIFFRANDPETAKFLSDAIGEKETIKLAESQQISPENSGDRRGMAEQDRTEKVLLPSEIQAFKKYESVIKFSGHGIAKLTIPKVFYKKVAEHFIEKEFKMDFKLSETKESKPNVKLNDLLG